MRGDRETSERAMARMATHAHGLVTRAQLVGAGLSFSEIDHRLATGALLREHRGVNRVGHRAPSRESRYLAAVLAAGDGALLCGRAAGHLLGLVGGSPPEPEVIARTGRSVPGVEVHRHRSGSPLPRTTWLGIPVTTVPRTLLDLAGTLPPDDLARACHEAGIRHGTTPTHVEAVMALRPRSPGAGALRRVLGGDEAVVLSELEAGFRERLAAAGLPLPVMNRPAGGRRVDCRWPGHRLTVEVDGYRFHRSRHAWERDRLREREAYARGDEFRRYTYGDVLEHPQRMLTELHALLPSTHPG
ncbi:MAG: hypothetical protein U0T02_12330 [Solirubrobacteraceae bacterium]